MPQPQPNPQDRAAGLHRIDPHLAVLTLFAEEGTMEAAVTVICGGRRIVGNLTREQAVVEERAQIFAAAQEATNEPGRVATLQALADVYEHILGEERIKEKRSVRQGELQLDDVERQLSLQLPDSYFTLKDARIFEGEAYIDTPLLRVRFLSVDAWFFGEHGERPGTTTS